MSIILLVVAGFLSSFEAGDSCIDALHQLRTEERLHIVATEVLEDNVLAYTLSDSPRLAAKTAILICQRDLDAVEDEGDPDIRRRRRHRGRRGDRRSPSDRRDGRFDRRDRRD